MEKFIFPFSMKKRRSNAHRARAWGHRLSWGGGQRGYGWSDQYVKIFKLPRQLRLDQVPGCEVETWSKPIQPSGAATVHALPLRPWSP
jgi:hypothetical protein